MEGYFHTPLIWFSTVRSESEYQIMSDEQRTCLEKVLETLFRSFGLELKF